MRSLERLAPGLAELVGLGGREPGDVDGHLHELLLEQRYPEGLGQGPLQQRVQVGHRLLTVAAADVGVDRAALDRARPDQGHLHQGRRTPRLEPGQGSHLGPALDLEHPDRVGRAQHVVDGRLLGQLGQVDLDPVVAADQVDGGVQGREHPRGRAGRT